MFDILPIAVDPVTAGSVIDWVMKLGGLGLSAYLVTITLPALLERHREEIVGINKRHDEFVDKQYDRFEKMLKSEREHHKEIMRTVLREFVTEIKRLRREIVAVDDDSGIEENHVG